MSSVSFSRRTLAALTLLGALIGALSGCASPNGEATDSRSSDAQVADSAVVAQKVEAARERLTQNEGGRLVLDAIDAHGGLQAWYRAPTSSYVWTYANVGADLQFTTLGVIDNQTRRAYHDLRSVGPYENPQPVDARFAWDGETAWIAPDSLQQPNPHFWALTGFYFEQIPFVLADPGLRYERLPDETLDGTTYDMVRVAFDRGVGDTPGDTYTLYVHPETRQVDAIRYTVSYGQDVEPGADLPETLFEYRDFVTVDGLTVATRFEGFSFANGTRGDFKNRALADSISFRRPFDASRLEPPPNARIVPPPTPDS